jgi:hypothetical protein
MEVRSIAGERQRGLFARRDFKLGDELYRERASVFEAADGARSFSSGAPPSPAQVAALFLAAPYYLEEPKPLEQFGGLDSVVTAVLDANAFNLISGGRGLFELLARCNHSCAANCAITELEAGEPGLPWYALVARCDIRAGDELEIAYVPRAWPQERRKRELLEKWGFACGCARCAAASDDTCVLRCRSCDGGRVFLRAASCADCGAASVAIDQAAAQGGSDAALAVARLPADASLSERVEAALHDPLRAHEDAAVFASLCELLAELQDADGAEALLARVAQAVALASLRTPFITPEELGFDVER